MASRSDSGWAWAAFGCECVWLCGCEQGVCDKENITVLPCLIKDKKKKSLECAVQIYDSCCHNREENFRGEPETTGGCGVVVRLIKAMLSDAEVVHFTHERSSCPTGLQFFLCFFFKYQFYISQHNTNMKWM